MPDTKSRQPDTKNRRQPRQERSRDLVRAVREAGRLLLAEEGPSALTTTRIAERAGVSVGSIYQYFENKEAILAAIYDEANELEVADVGNWLEELRTVGPKERLRVGIEYVVAHHRHLLELDAKFYREHHAEYRISTYIPADPQREYELGEQAVDFSRQLLEQADLGGDVHIEHAAFLLGRGISAIVRAALESSPDRLADPAFTDELVRMVSRYVFPNDPD